ncbi:MAG: phospho-N-acetylmuramoyl-pentapeptide-transferase [Oscillospiraceae bacterium]
MENMSSIVVSLSAFVITAILGAMLIPILRKMKFGQTILEEGPSWHKAKEGTPTMGGIMFIGGIVIAVIIGYFVATSFDKNLLKAKELTYLFGGLIMALLFGLIGFLDDYIKVVKKQNLGLSAAQKLILQIIVTVLYLFFIYYFCGKSTSMNVPFFGEWDMGVFYYPVMGILIVGIVNSTNLTDGIDGLLGSVTFVVGIFFIIASSVFGFLGMSILSSALAGGCLGFLCYNLHPAKVFMGDTGSLFLGGMVVALAFGMNAPFLLFLVGFIYCVESLSVMLQVLSVKIRGKRIFRMSPIHHHYEMGGMSEKNIVIFFSSVTAVMCLIAFFSIKLI